MRSSMGDPSGGDAPDADAAGEPDPAELELVVELDDEFDEELLAETEPNSAASEFETIDGDEGARPFIWRLPRAVRIVGALAAAVALAFAVWPTAGARRAMPRPTPTPSQVDADLYKVRLNTTSLRDDDSVDHAVLGLVLTNGSTSQLSVLSAELWDAVGTRLGSATVWPVSALSGGSTASVPVTLPYDCGGELLPVLPLTIRYSISTPQNPSVRRDYAYPLSDTLWDDYTRQQTAACARAGSATSLAGNEVALTGIDTTQPIGAPTDPQGFDLAFTMEAAGTTAWTVQNPTTRVTGITVTAIGPPVVVTPGQTARVVTHWHVASCAQPPAWYEGRASVSITARLTGAGAIPAGSSTSSTSSDPSNPSEQVFYASLRPVLVTEMMRVACGS